MPNTSSPAQFATFIRNREEKMYDFIFDFVMRFDLLWIADTDCMTVTITDPVVADKAKNYFTHGRCEGECIRFTVEHVGVRSIFKLFIK